MPGLCIRRGDGTRGFAAVLDALRHDDGYERAVLVDDGTVRVGSVAYPEYPVSTHERDGLRIVLEGRLYDRPRAEVGTVAPELFDGDLDAVASWVRSVDGEFVCCAVDPDGERVAVLTDNFGRLPVYYHDDGDRLLAGRDPGFVLEGTDVPFDRMGLAQVLLFAYTLGDRTLWEDVRTLPPAGLLTAGPDGTSVERLHRFDFDEPAHADRSVGQNATELAARFREACRRRATAGGHAVVSLSGGHDSRAVAAGCSTERVPYTAATFQQGDPDADVRIAREVADALGVDWERYDVPGVDRDSMARLLALKRGMNHLGMAYLLPFLDAVVDRHGRDATYITGDGGDKVVPDLTPARRVDGLDDLVDYVVAHNDVRSLAEVEQLTGVPRDEVRSEVRSVLAGYPEERMAAKYVHFLTHERGFNWLFEGEDRNRGVCWSTSPFYATDVFTYGMDVPADQKANNRFYRAFLRELWPAAVEFDDADFGTPMASPRYGLVKRLETLLARYPAVEDVARVLYRGEVDYEAPEPVLEAARDHLADCDAVGRYLDREAAAEVFDDGGRSRQQCYTLFTVAAAIADRDCERGALADREPVPAR